MNKATVTIKGQLLAGVQLGALLVVSDCLSVPMSRQWVWTVGCEAQVVNISR